MIDGLIESTATLALAVVDGDDSDDCAAAPKQRTVALSEDRINSELTNEVRSLLHAADRARDAQKIVHDAFPERVRSEETMVDYHGAQFDQAQASLVAMLQMLVGDDGAVQLRDGTIVGVQSSPAEDVMFNQLFVIKPENLIRLEA